MAFVQSTTTGEQMVLRALGIPASGGHIVTDTLHFFGSFPLYEELARQGMQVTWVKPRDNQIVLQDMEKAIRKGTKLVALSAVSTFNGFQHDLKAVCDIAHANGALVYADIIHAAGCVPLTCIRAASILQRARATSGSWAISVWASCMRARIDCPSSSAPTTGTTASANSRPMSIRLIRPLRRSADYAFENSATGAFALGTHGESVMAQLNYSLDYI